MLSSLQSFPTRTWNFSSSRLLCSIRWNATSTNASSPTPLSLPPELKIFFGSQTGTAKGFATQLARELKKKNLKPQVIDMKNYSPASLSTEAPGSLAVFVTACYGTGQPTDNAKQMFEWIMSQEPEKVGTNGRHLGNLEYAIFGLGKKKTYADRYQAVARALDQRLEQLGANRLLRKGEGDDDGAIEDDFMEWKQELLKAVSTRYKVSHSSPPTSQPTPSETSTCQKEATKSTKATEADLYQTTSHWKVDFTPVQNHLPLSPYPVLETHLASSQIDLSRPILLPLSRNTEMKQPWMNRSTKHISFDFQGSGLTYEAGDHLGVFPQNPPSLIEATAKRLGVKLEATFKVTYPENYENHEGGAWNADLPPECSVYEFLASYCDLRAVPRRSVLEGLAHWATDSCEKSNLFQLARSEDYNMWAVESRRNVLEFLEAFPSVRPEFAHFVELMMRNPVQCRYYSISSSPKFQPKQLDLLVDVVQYTALTGVEKFGLASGYLSSLSLGSRVPVFVRTSTFRLPADPTIPVVLVGAGSGLAPLRGFLQEREHIAIKEGKKLGPSILYFGCDRKKGDFLHQEELEQHSRNTLVELRCSFAFDQESRIFVQHLMKEDSPKLWEWLSEKGAHLYVCGNARTVGAGVYDFLKELARTQGKMNHEKAGEYVTQLVNTKRLQEDVF